METDFLRENVLVKCVPKASLFSEDNLHSLNFKLESSDALSLLYLMGDGIGVSGKLYDEVCKSEICKGSSRVKFSELCIKYVKDWAEKIIEALVEVELYNVLLTVFGVNKFDAVYNIEINDRALNCNKIRLFKICEGLDRCNEKLFLTKMAETIGHEHMPLTEHKYMELYFMFWNMKDLINPSTGKGFDKIVRCLQELGLNSLLDIIIPEGRSGVSLALSLDDYNLDTYPILDENDVGLCVIVNQFDFDDPDNNRAASCLDESYLTAVMENFQVKVQPVRNLNSLEFAQVIKQTINQNFKETHSVLFVVIMSHGVEGHVMGKDGKYVSMRIIAQALHEAKGIRRKPKVLIVCACRGDSVYTAHSTGYYEADGSGKDPKAIRSDIMDLVTCYSTIPGFISIRNTKKGSLFMQVLCDVLEKKGDLEVCEIFTLVNNALMNPKDFRIYNPAKIAHPCEFNSRLLKKLYLKKKVKN